MQTYNRNVCLAASLLILGGILIILGVSLYLKGDPEESGEISHPSVGVYNVVSQQPIVLRGSAVSTDAVVCRDRTYNYRLPYVSSWILGVVSCIPGMEARGVFGRAHVYKIGISLRII